MTSTSAKIAPKGCASTGITEETAEKFYNQLGRKCLAIVEISSHSRQENEDGKQAVTLQILTIEPSPTQATDDHLRELARSFYYERRLVEGQLEIETTGDLEPKVADVIAARPGLLPHEYVSMEQEVDGDLVTPDECDVCGDAEPASIHRVTPDLDPFAVPGEEPDEDGEE